MRKKRQRHGDTTRGQKLMALIRGFFRTRQIYVRSRSDVHYITFTPLSQAALVLVCLAGLFWSAFASINLLFKDQLLELKQQKLFEARLDYEHQLAEMRAAIEAESDKLLINQQSYLKKVDEVESRFRELEEQQRRLHGYFSQGWVPVKPASQSEPLPAAPQVEGSLRPLPSQTYAADFRSDEDVVAPLAAIDEQLEQLHGEHLRLMKDGLAYADAKLDRSAELMRRVNVTVPPAPVQESNEGGPFIPVKASASAREQEFSTALSAIESVLRHNDTVLRAVENFPLTLPMQVIERQSSDYGFRTDPLRHTLALHGGIDFVSPYGTPVLATANGTVTWAGLHGPYGNLVEIQHDNGIATRYGHLRGVNVALGQSVKNGDIVGWLGNTGRSTGPHLHYETRVNGHALDPQNFWRIRNDIQALKNNDNEQ